MPGAKIHITGIVQGVGFRPFVYNLAARLALKGWVKNTSAGVDIEVDGEQKILDDFIRALRDEAPPLSRIDDFTASFGPGNGFTQFDIIHSESMDGAFQPISPDVAICDDCLRELFDPNDRRYRYPFINCTNCGPRFTIIKDIPYDRPFTTMAGFKLCPDCEREYKDPTNRRFHAQPVACPVCGPKIWLEVGATRESPLQNDDAFTETKHLLSQGKIIAIKGLGGFHLACDATNAKAVKELRTRKLRVDKPFALMMPDIETIEQHCFVSDEEKALLISPARPIVLLKKRSESTIVEEVSPKQDWLGVMLPYTPLHYLFFNDGRQTTDDSPSSGVHRPLSALVMTSGNLSEEPIATGNDEARERLAKLADAFLMHDRDIHVRCDDSVVRVFSEQPQITNHQLPITYPIRRSRGYSPFPVKLPFQVPPLLATGSELKNTFCITNGNYAFLSHHIGDMENYETLKSFEQGVEHFECLFRVKPAAIAHDMHPNYLATRYALERAEREDLPTFSIQHHHAHVAACMAEHGLTETVIGVSFDGTGYGDDGAIWGGEFLVADYKSYQRAAHLEYFPLPGGDAAIKKPARTALALLWSLGMDWDGALESVEEFCAEDQVTLRVQLEKKINTPMTSSMGRLFDAAAALAGVRQKVNYEGQAAIEFEAMADSAEAGHYAFGVESGQVRVRRVVEALVKDVMAGVSIPRISARFHNGLAEAVRETVQRISGETSIRSVVLSGGVWQNLTLLRRTLSLLRESGFEVYIHREVPTNDGGLSLGQAAIAATRLRG
ncbi:MAG TPA: carbamoyltransferase HypF [Anaerolineae bacterium]|nr:carbamoyltransferase HypF [Anaerolineae bacterium]HRJ57777.1 carbamoyltransferase HypF [Anaerolineales bacterium]